MKEEKIMKKVVLTLSAFLALFFLAQTLLADGLPKIAYNGDLEGLKKALSKPFDPDERDSFGGTALHAAMFQKNLEVVKLLIKKGFDVNAIGPNNGYTPMHDAVWADNLPALKLLVENGGDLSIKGHDGYTPLQKAKAEKKQDIVKYLEGLKKSKGTK